MKKIILAILVIFLSLSCDSMQELHFKTIQQGKFVSTIVETGDLEAVNSELVRVPLLGWEYGTPKIVDLVEEGTLVQAGDFIAQLDTSSIYKSLQQQRNDAQIARAKLGKMHADNINKIKQLEAELVAMESSYNLLKMQVERVINEPERQRKISELKLEKAKIALEKSRRQIETTRIVHENEIKIQKLKIVQLENEIQDSFRAIRKTRLTAPCNGLVEYKSNGRTDQKIRIGDEVWVRSSIIGIPDLSRMRVTTSVSETDIGKVFVGQKVIVRLDAFARKQFLGHITEITRLPQEDRRNDGPKTYSILVLLDEHDPILRPGMTVSCEFFIAELDYAIFVDNDCIFKEGSKYYLHLKKGSSTKKQEITIGPQNNRFTVVYGDVKAGQQVLVNGGAQ